MKKNPKKLLEAIECRIVEHIRYMVENKMKLVDIFDTIHNNLFNTDYWVIGSYNARKELQEFPDGLIIVEYIQKKEIELFGALQFTEWQEPERVLNLLVYHLSEEIIAECGSITQFKGYVPRLRAVKKKLNRIVKEKIQLWGAKNND